MRTGKEWNRIGRNGWEKFKQQQGSKELSDLVSTLEMLLTEREYDAVTKLFGLTPDELHEPCKIKALATEYGVTKERMLQILEKAFRKLRDRNVELIADLL